MASRRGGGGVLRDVPLMMPTTAGIRNQDFVVVEG